MSSAFGMGFWIDEDGTFSNTAADGGLASMTDSFYIYFHDGSNNANAVKGNSNEATNIFAASSGEVVKFRQSVFQWCAVDSMMKGVPGKSSQSGYHEVSEVPSPAYLTIPGHRKGSKSFVLVLLK